MFNKYEVSSYQDYFQLEYPKKDKEKIKSTFKNIKNNYINQKINSDKNLSQEFVISKGKDSIYNILSGKKNTIQRTQYGGINRDIKTDFKYSNIKKNIIPSLNYVEQKFSCTYINGNTEKKNKNTNENNINSLNKRISLNKHLNQNNNQVPNRTIKFIQSQFDVEKSNDFKVSSYKPEDYDYISKNIEGKSKIIQIFKKQNKRKLFNPIKRAKSPSYNISSSKQKLGYQAPTLQFQSFFASFTRPIHTKNNSHTQSESILRKNQLQDFNIDKLIEIGDSYEKNNMKNIMSFGKKIASIKNKMKNRKLISNFFNENVEKSYDEIIDKNENIIQEQKKGNENDNNIDKKLSPLKNIVYNGQIKRKRNVIKNAKTSYNFQNKEINFNNNKENNKVANTNIYNEKKELNNNSCNNNNINPKIKRRTVMPYHKRIDYLNKKINENKIYNENIPSKAIIKSEMDLSLNIYKSNCIININNKNSKIDNILKRNKFINNYINNENISHGELGSKILLLNQEMINQNSNKIINENKQNKKKIEDENLIKSYKIINYSNKQIPKNSRKNFMLKNYYGYDNRSHLERGINNHSYFESIYSRKKIDRKNISTDKINN